MISKAEKTKQYIIETVAPLFNKKGYADTSLTDVIKATGLSKGSVYGNFQDKEELALEAFNHNMRLMIWPLADRINAKNKAAEKLNAIFDYYRQYYDRTLDFGGCPILNVGIDANHQNTPLKKKVRSVVAKLIKSIEVIIEQGQHEGAFKSSVNANQLAKRIYSSIEGSIFTAMMQEDEEHIKDMMEFLNTSVSNELKV